MNDIHLPVMLQESLKGLNLRAGGLYIDATFGGGGHTQAMLKQDVRVIAIDRDEEAITLGRRKFGTNPKLTLVHDNFLNLADILHTLKIKTVDGILFDLGTSAFQLAGEGRGFSFMRDEPLDMRMDKRLTVTAKDLVNALGRKELIKLFTKFAQEPKSAAISDAILKTRQLAPITTTKALADLISRVYGKRQGKLHPATKVFQALRIAVNDELNNLQSALFTIPQLLSPNGRLSVISFHEGEDRIVKTGIKDLASRGELISITGKPLTPAKLELQTNPKARSAKLRIAAKPPVTRT